MEYVSLRCTLNRGFFHIIAGSLPVIASLFLPWAWVVLGIAAATVIFVSLEMARLHIPSLNRQFSAWLAPLLRQEEQTKLTGASYLLIGYLITALIAPHHIALLAMLFASLGDPAATMVGVWKGRTKRWGKSAEGTVTCLMICLATSILAAITIGALPLTIAIAGAVAATLLEALPLRLNDNVTVSVGSAAVMVVLGLLF